MPKINGQIRCTDPKHGKMEKKEGSYTFPKTDGKTVDPNGAIIGSAYYCKECSYTEFYYNGTLRQE